MLEIDNSKLYYLPENNSSLLRDVRKAKGVPRGPFSAISHPLFVSLSTNISLEDWLALARYGWIMSSPAQLFSNT